MAPTSSQVRFFSSINRRLHLQKRAVLFWGFPSSSKDLEIPNENIFLRNKEGVRPFCSADSIQDISFATELIRMQHWSKLKTHLETTNLTTFLLQLFNSDADPALILRYFYWSMKELRISHSLVLTGRLLDALAAAKEYPKMREFYVCRISLFSSSNKQSVSSVIINMLQEQLICTD
ncbi:Pentatricopeptide repeat-containing protein [Melia azedarach]|uniref:Pentatricopeptide repeat-containing protein n=1 Tax=Melia azedarach TaxID=155640 RepID=A0ACC1Y2E1_MELAZ|nr:Pentatricopeptide repeat-containing protein [Melia azedarach]